MLVLTRKPNEQIMIGDQVTITVTRIKGNTIQLGIDAPKDVKILRGELACRNSRGERTVDEEPGFAWPTFSEADETAYRLMQTEAPETASHDCRPSVQLALAAE